MATILYRSNNWGEPLGVLPYLTFAHEEDVDDGTDMLTVVTRGWASKRDRLLWQDIDGTWHEHIVDAAVTERQDGVLVTTLTCSNSISELFGQSMSFVTWTGVYYGNPDGLLDTILDGTHWEMGDNDTFEGVDIEIWAKSKRQCITELCELVHGELVTEILVSGTRVVGRKVSIVHKRGDQTVKHYFAWGVNASSIRREVAADEVYTEVYGVGAPIQVDSSNYPVRYVSTVGDSSLIDDYGMVHRIPLPEEEYGTEMGEAGSYDDYTEERGHYTLMYVDDSLDSTEKLQAACTRQLRQNNQPLISYTFEFADIEGDGMAGLSLGDAVLVRDDEMGRVTTKRVTHVTRTYYGRADTGRECSASMQVVVGERKNNMFEQLEASEKLGQWVTGNHVNVNARESMSTKGKYDRSGSSGPIKGADGNLYNIGVDEDGNVVAKMMPSAIEVVEPPDRTEYVDGDSIRYEGIAVQLLDGNGNVFTDERYPDGMVPFGELSFPENEARYVPASGQATFTTPADDSSRVYRNYGITFSFALVPIGTVFFGNSHSEVDGVDVWRTYTLKEATEPVYACIFHNVNESPTKYDYVHLASLEAFTLHYMGPTGTGGISEEDQHVYKGTNCASTTRQAIVGKNAGLFPRMVTSTGVSYSNSGDDMVKFGTGEYESSIMDAPVQWTCPYDGRVLEDTTEIRVRKS